MLFFRQRAFWVRMKEVIVKREAVKISLLYFLFVILCMLFYGCAETHFDLHFQGERNALFRNGSAFGFRECLQEQLERHPDMAPEEVLKLCVLGAYGPVSAPEKQTFDRTFQIAAVRTQEPLMEWISPDFIRVNYGAWKRAGMPAQWLFQMVSATRGLEDGKAVLQNALVQAEQLLSGEMRQRFLQLIRSDAVSPQKIRQYTGIQPTYCVVSSRFLNVLPVLKKAAALPEKPVRVIAVDGRAASGKTTLARQLEMILDTDAIHMDDFFLPLELRTQERYREPGGNVHYERFIQEVLPHVNTADPFSYRKFDCSVKALGKRTAVRRSSWRVVEGAYALHPKFGDYADLKVFYDVSPGEQMRRIRLRNGEQAAKMFRDRWIPLEELYIRHADPAGRADLVIGGSRGTAFL